MTREQDLKRFKNFIVESTQLIFPPTDLVAEYINKYPSTDLVINKTNHEQIVGIFNNLCVNLPKVQVISSKRKKTINARAKEHGLEVIGLVLNKVAESDFLNGKNKNNWKATFDWIFNPNNFVKILEDNYKNKEKIESDLKINRQTIDTIKENSIGWD